MSLKCGGRRRKHIAQPENISASALCSELKNEAKKKRHSLENSRIEGGGVAKIERRRRTAAVKHLHGSIRRASLALKAAALAGGGETGDSAWRGIGISRLAKQAIGAAQSKRKRQRQTKPAALPRGRSYQHNARSAALTTSRQHGAAPLKKWQQHSAAVSVGARQWRCALYMLAASPLMAARHQQPHSSTISSLKAAAA